jgi:hypothetical protein
VEENQDSQRILCTWELNKERELNIQEGEMIKAIAMEGNKL